MKRNGGVLEGGLSCVVGQLQDLRLIMREGLCGQDAVTVDR